MVSIKASMGSFSSLPSERALQWGSSKHLGTNGLFSSSFAFIHGYWTNRSQVVFVFFFFFWFFSSSFIFWLFFWQELKLNKGDGPWLNFASYFELAEFSWGRWGREWGSGQRASESYESAELWNSASSFFEHRRTGKNLETDRPSLDLGLVISCKLCCSGKWLNTKISKYINKALIYNVSISVMQIHPPSLISSYHVMQNAKLVRDW